jgi:hypothetical protein
MLALKNTVALFGLASFIGSSLVSAGPIVENNGLTPRNNGGKDKGKDDSGSGSGSKESDQGSDNTLPKAPGPCEYNIMARAPQNLARIRELTYIPPNPIIAGKLIEPTDGTVIYTEVDWPGFGQCTLRFLLTDLYIDRC